MYNFNNRKLLYMYDSREKNLITHCMCAYNMMYCIHSVVERGGNNAYMFMYIYQFSVRHLHVLIVISYFISYNSSSYGILSVDKDISTSEHMSVQYIIIFVVVYVTCQLL